MIVTAKNNVNIRANEPARSKSNLKGQLYKGFSIEVENTRKNGEPINGNSTWYQDKNGDWYWSGGFDSIRPSYTDKDQRKVSPLDWWHHEFEIQKLWTELGNRGENATIGILDSGIDRNHPYFNSSQITGSSVLSNPSDYSDNWGHGTQVASILLANGERMIGIAPSAKLHMVKIFNSNGAIVENLANGIMEMNDVDIICISQTLSSLHNTQDKDSIQQALNSIDCKLVVCACGNSNRRDIFEENLPAALENTISVASTQVGQKLSSYSSQSKNIDMAAPGHNVKCLLPKRLDYFGPESGTSYAAPFIAGVLSIGITYLRNKGVELPAASQFRSILHNCTNQKDPYELFGRGVFNTTKFINQIQQL